MRSFLLEEEAEEGAEEEEEVQVKPKNDFHYGEDYSEATREQG